MNILVPSVRCRAIQRQFLSMVRSKDTSNPWLHNNLSVACVRFASVETKPGFLSRLKNIFTRSSDEKAQMSPRIRSVVDLAPRSDEPPIKEPNMPENRDENDDEQEKKDINPVIKTDNKTDESEEERFYKNRWGVRVPDDNSDARVTEETPNYVVSQKWDDNVRKYKDAEDLNVQNTSSATSIQLMAEKTMETDVRKTRTVPDSLMSQKEKEQLSYGMSAIESSCSQTLILPKNEDETTLLDLTSNATTTVTLSSSNYFHVDDDYNIPKELPQDGEITAWQDVVTRSKLHEKDSDRRKALAAEIQLDVIESVFIRPEPPEPKNDLQVVRSVSKIENLQHNVPKTLNLSPNIGGTNFTVTKKLHTWAMEGLGYRGLARTCHTFARSQWFLTTSQCGKYFENFSPDSEYFTEIKADEKRTHTRAGEPQSDVAAIAEGEFDNFFQELSQREIDILLSCKQQSSVENKSCPNLVTSVEMAKILAESLQHTWNSVKRDESLNNDTIAVADVPELEKTILMLKEIEDKKIKEKKARLEFNIGTRPGPYQNLIRLKQDNETSQTRNKTITNKTNNSSDRKKKRKSLGWLRAIAVGAEQPTDRVQTIHPDIEPPKRDVVERSSSKDQTSKLVQNPQSIDVKTTIFMEQEEISKDPEAIKQRRQRAIDDEMEAARAYEMKNYAYVRPEDNKDPRELLIKRAKKLR